jgi:hypothetical protein
VKRAGRCAVAAVVATAAAGSAWAHKPSDAHLHLAVDGSVVRGRLDVAVRDLDAALTLDTDGDGQVTWGELTSAAGRIDGYVRDHLSVSGGPAPCPLAFGAAEIVELSDGAYRALPLHAQCARDAGAPAVSYRLLFEIDAQHRGLVHVEGQRGGALVVRDGSPVRIATGGDTSFTDFVAEGIRHIATGFDHLLFLAALILPAGLILSRQARPSPQGALRDAATEVLEIVTAFTLAHSITLVVSAVGFVRLPSRLVESAIALSVAAAAANNLVRWVDARWAVAFALGLLHGFGFSSVLVDLGLPSRALLGALLGFNLGVELGQLAFVAAALPVLFAIRRTAAYRALLWGGSAAIVVVAAIWSVQRLSP